MVFSFTQSTEEKRRNSFDRYERLIKRQRTITSAVDNFSADTGNEEEENVEESVEKAVQVDLIKIIIADRKTYIATRNSIKEFIQHDRKRQQII